MPWTQTELDALKRAFAGGTLRVTYDGKTYALVVDGDVHLLYYRKDIFEDPENMEAFKAEYGYDMPVPPAPVLHPQTLEQGVGEAG